MTTIQFEGLTYKRILSAIDYGMVACRLGQALLASTPYAIYNYTTCDATAAVAAATGTAPETGRNS